MASPCWNFALGQRTVSGTGGGILRSAFPRSHGIFADETMHHGNFRGSSDLDLGVWTCVSAIQGSRSFQAVHQRLDLPLLVLAGCNVLRVLHR